MIQRRWEVRLITKIKDGEVLRSVRVCYIWIKEGEAFVSARLSIAQRFGGDMLVPDHPDTGLVFRTVPDSSPEIEEFAEGEKSGSIEAHV